MLRPQKPSLGGNALLKPKNNTKCKTKDEKKEAARCRAANNLNCTVEQLENFAVIYKNLVCGAKTAGCVYESQDGMIAAFLGKGLSEVQIRSFLPVGGHKVQRIRNELKDPSLREKRNMPRVPSHAVSDEDIERLVEQAKEWDLEDGFPDYVDDFPEDEDIADDGEEHVALTIDGDEEPPITLTPGTVQVQAEDFAGSFALPHYGFLRPSSDFYHSNLMQHNFIVSENTNHNHMYWSEKLAVIHSI